MGNCSLRDAFLFHKLGNDVQCLLCLIAHTILALQSTLCFSHSTFGAGYLIRAGNSRLTISGILDDMMI
jgi:hypothetical protein